MTDATIAAALLNFAGAAGFTTMLIGRENCSPLTNKLFWLLGLGGIASIALALFLFVQKQGLQYGIVYWGGTGLVCSFIVIFFLTGKADGIRSILAVLAFGVGIYFAMRSVLSIGALIGLGAAAFMIGNQIVLFVMPVLAGYAGFEAWPLYVIVVVGAASGVWNLLYFGTTPLKFASGGPLAYLLRIAILNSIIAAIFYAAGVGIARLVGH